VEVADAEGLAGLSMRKVADRLGFTSMSLYRHVPGRDHLVDLMCDAVLGPLAPEFAEDAGAGGWRTRLEAWARAGWRLRQRYPWLAEVRGPRHVPGPNAIAHFQYGLRVVAEAGLPPAEVIAVVGLIGRFVEAESVRLVEAAEVERLSGVTEEDWWGARDTLFARFDRYPTLTAFWEAGAFDEPEDPFEFGLRTLLDGVESLVRRYETRDETCPVCGTLMERSGSGRPREYCSRACRQRAYRQRTRGGQTETPTPPLV
jgi:AcrR family transcriptional regulator